MITHGNSYICMYVFCYGGCHFLANQAIKKENKKEE